MTEQTVQNELPLFESDTPLYSEPDSEPLVQDVVEVPASAPTVVRDPMQLLQLAVERDLDISKLEKLMDLQDRWEKKLKLEAFMRDMNLCQQEMPIIVRDKQNEHTKSMYATLDATNLKIRETYTKYGFSLSFNEEQKIVETHLHVQAIVRHREGHEAHYRVNIPLDGTGIKGASNMTGTQGFGSTMSYARRYLIYMIFNCTILAEDNDGNPESRFLNEEEIKTIRDKIQDFEDAGIELREGGLMDWIGKMQKAEIHTWGEIKSRFFNHVISALDKKYREAMKKKRGG